MGYVHEGELVLFRRGTFYSDRQTVLNQKRQAGLAAGFGDTDHW